LRWFVRAERLAVVALRVDPPAALVVGTLMFKRNLSLPTADGRMPFVGEDRELSREARLHHQTLRARGRFTRRYRLVVEHLERPREAVQAQTIESEGIEDK
jgi:hypothetical protein